MGTSRAIQGEGMSIVGLLVLANAWGQANFYAPDVTIAFEDLVTDASESDRD